MSLSRCTIFRHSNGPLSGLVCCLVAFIAATFALYAQAPAYFAINTAPLAPESERFGVNIDFEDLNNWTLDPGFEAQILRLRLTADGGGPAHILKDQDETTSYWDTIADGFFDGATVRVYRYEQGSIQKLREGTATSYWASPANGYRIDLDANGPAVQAGDVVFLDLEADTAPVDHTHARMTHLRRAASGLWEVSGGAAYARVTSATAPVQGGHSSLQLTTAASQEVSIRQYRYGHASSGYPHFVPGRTYRVSVWLRQEGLASGEVAFRLTGGYQGHVQTTFQGVTGDWQQFTHDFTGPPEPPAGMPIAEHVLAFTGPGTVWFDNFTIHDPTQPVLAFMQHAQQALTDFRPGPVRLWSGQTNTAWGTTLENWTDPEILRRLTWDTNSGPVMTPGFTLPTALPSVQRAGGHPWLIVGAFLSESEWLGLIEYLAGPQGTPYGDKRAGQGQSRPWSDEFDSIRIEYGNESWNTLFAPWDFSDPELYAAFAEYFFQVAQSSPYWSSIASKVEFIVNGWAIQPGSTGYGARAVVASPAAAMTDTTAYIGGWEAGGSIAGDVFTDAGLQTTLTYGPLTYFPNTDQHVATQRSLAGQGRSYRLAVYEGGPGYDLPSPEAPFKPIHELYGKCLASAVTTLDCFLYGVSRGFGPQSFFRFQPGPNWASHTDPTVGYRPHPCLLALQMHNRHAVGAPISSVAHALPTLTVDAGTGDGQTRDLPLVSITPLRRDDQWSVFVLSRSVTQTVAVMLDLPFESVQTGVRHSLTGSPADSNLVASDVGIQTEVLTQFSQQFQFDLPPATAFLFVWTGCQLATPPAWPVPTVNRHFSQPETSASEELLFVVSFNEPVIGFTAGDISLSGTAQATTVAVEQLDPLDAAAYLVRVTGMQHAGSVQIVVAAGAAETADHRPSQEPVILEDTVQFAPPVEAEWLLAYDDFNIAPDQTPHPPFAAEAASGSGWSGGWNVQNFQDAQSYGDGYRYSQGNLAHASLLRVGHHMTGGRSYEIAGRTLDLQQARFTDMLVEHAEQDPTIGAPGTTLWFSCLLRKNAETNDRCMVYLARDPIGWDARIGVGSVINQSDGKRYWTLGVAQDPSLVLALHKSTEEAAIGTSALLVLRCDFGAAPRFRLWIDPANPGGEDPGAPDLDVAGTAGFDYSFRCIGFYPGYDVGCGAVDEIRLGTSFRSVAPVEGVVARVDTQPAGGARDLGSDVTLSVSAWAVSLTYQWRKDGIDIPSATQSSLPLGTLLRDDVGVYDVVLRSSYDYTFSAPAPITIEDPVGAPVIGVQPQSTTVTVGDLVTLWADAVGTPAPSYQWYKESTPVAGATTRMFALPYVMPEDAAAYHVLVSNEHGSVASAAATVQVNTAPGWEPLILTHPYGQAFRPGETFLLSVAANGYPVPTYQWRKDDVDIPGATSASLTVSTTGEGDAGAYTVVVSNALGSATSEPAAVVLKRLVTATDDGHGHAALALTDGTGLTSPAWIAEGEQVQLAATADPGYVFDTWTGDFGQQVDTGSAQITVTVLQTLDVQCRFTATDTDGDGLPDPWELAFWAAINAAGAGPNDDPDGDGYTNFQEYTNGTNPLVPTILLLPGWNLVSVSWLPAVNASLTDQLGGAAALPIMAWDGAAYVDIGGGRQRNTDPLQPLNGYWIYAYDELLVDAVGTEWGDGAVALQQGWNLVGPIRGGPIPTRDPADWQNHVWRWSAEQQRYIHVTDRLDATHGYWILSPAPTPTVLP